MPKSKVVLRRDVKVKKQTKAKLSPAERSQIAKDRWAKIRKDKAAQKPTPKIEVDWDGALAAVKAENDAPKVSELTASGLAVQVESDGGKTLIPAPLDTLLNDAVANAPEGVDRVDIVTSQGNILASREIKAEQDTPTPVAPAPQLAPVKAPKQKRYTGPKEFSVALKAAEQRLAKAINERAEAMGKLAGLNAEIPSLLQIINALKGPSNVSPVPYDVSGSYPNPAMFQTPVAPQFQAPVDLMDAIRAAMAAPPVSMAIGNAVQLPPDVVGTLEGPDDDNPDKFITGEHAGGGWIGA
jgi:hypothetical protein